jgi:tetratricopeptide (TPR) repeat protein
VAKQKVNRGSSHWVVLLGALAVLSGPRQGMTGAEVTGPSTERARAGEELKQGAQAFRAGRYDEAQEHYRTALKLDPAQKTAAALFLARSIRAQYQPGIADRQNVAKAKEAIAAYEKALQDNPGQDEAFASVADLYGALKEDAHQRDWILKRAKSDRLPPAARSSAYRRAAELDLVCARTTADSDPAGADNCAALGLVSISQAIALSGDNEGALTQQIQLLHQRAKLAETQSGSTQKQTYETQAAAAEKRIAKLREEGRIKSESLPTY